MWCDLKWFIKGIQNAPSVWSENKLKQLVKFKTLCKYLSIFTFVLIDAQASELSESETYLVITRSISDLSLTSFLLSLAIWGHLDLKISKIF